MSTRTNSFSRGNSVHRIFHMCYMSLYKFKFCPELDEKIFNCSNGGAELLHIFIYLFQRTTNSDTLAIPAEVANNLKFPVHIDYLVLF